MKTKIGTCYPKGNLNGGRGSAIEIECDPKITYMCNGKFRIYDTVTGEDKPINVPQF